MVLDSGQIYENLEDQNHQSQGLEVCYVHILLQFTVDQGDREDKGETNDLKNTHQSYYIFS